MKKLIKVIGIMLLVLAASCAQEDVFDPAVSHNASVDVAVKSGDIKMEALMNYVKLNHPQASSRGVSDVLQPIVYLGDTICYFVNFEEGWELYSNSLTMPILLMKSETGQFDMGGFDTNPTFKAILELSKTALYEEKNDASAIAQAGSEEWDMYFTNTDTDTIAYSSNPILRKPVPQQTYIVGRGSYNESDTIDHLIATQWHQSYPYNEYCPYVTGTSSHAAAGCGAVAAAQFLYYAHYKWGVPENCVTTATYDSDKNTYTFSGASPTIWDDMPRYSYYDITAALLIGYSGKEMGTTYGTDSTTQGSSTKSSKLVSFLSSEANISISHSSFSSESVYNCLSYKKPVPSDIYGDSSSEKVGHAVIFDYCRRVRNFIEYYSAALSVDPGYGNLAPWMSYDEAIALYGDVSVSRIVSSTSYYFKVNWGWGLYADDPEINGSLLTVINGGYTFNTMYMLTY